MKKNYSKILVTKLNPNIHEKLKELAEGDRRTLSGLSRIIIEDYIKTRENMSDTDLNQAV